MLLSSRAIFLQIGSKFFEKFIPLLLQDPSRATTGTLTRRSTQMSKSLRAPWSSRTSRKPGTSSSHLKEPLFPIRIGFIADLNPTFVISADPDQGAKPVRIRILARLCCHKKLNFGMKIYVIICSNMS